MKTMPVIISLLFILIGEYVVAQEDLVVREFTTKYDAGSTVPVRDVLREYDQQQRLISEIRLRATTDATAWRNDSRMTYEYDDLDQLLHQTRTFYSINPERVIIEDDLTWEYDAAGRQIRYRLFRENLDLDRTEGFEYEYAYDENGCQSGRIGKTWDPDLQQFVLSETTIIENTSSCLPLNISSGEYETRYEYKFDDEGRPIAERTYQSFEGQAEELISLFSIEYGTDYEKRTFERFANDYQYVDSLVYDDEGRTIYRSEKSNLNSAAGLEPTTEYFWNYDENGNQILRVKNQSWNDLLEFWQTVSIDSTTFQPELTVERHELRQLSGPNTIERSSVTLNLTIFRCDGLPAFFSEYYENDGQQLDLSFLTRNVYAGPPECFGFVDLELFEVYPVPATDELHIRTPILGAGAARVRLIDMLGQTVLAETFAFANGTVLDLEGLSDGVYTVVVDFNKFIRTKKVVIQTP